MSISSGAKLIYILSGPFLGNEGSSRRNCTTNLYRLFLSSPVACTFSCTMKFTVRDCDPNTGVPEEDGYDDEYVVSSRPGFFFLVTNSEYTWPLDWQFPCRSEAGRREWQACLKQHFQNTVACNFRSFPKTLLLPKVSLALVPYGDRFVGTDRREGITSIVCFQDCGPIFLSIPSICTSVYCVRVTNHWKCLSLGLGGSKGSFWILRKCLSSDAQ